MFKSLREFTLDKPVNTKRLKIRHTREGHAGLACTIVQLWNTDVVHRVNVNNIVTLNTGGWKTASTKTTINTALKRIYGANAPKVFQSKGQWYIDLGQDSGWTLFFDGIILGGGSGIPYSVLN